MTKLGSCIKTSAHRHQQSKKNGLERDTDWSTSAVSGSLGTITKVSDRKIMGSYAKKIKKDNTLGLYQITQSLTLEKGKAYTLSAWMHRKEVAPTASRGAYLRVQYTKSAGSSDFRYSPYLTGTKEVWERQEFSFTLPSNAASSIFYLGIGRREFI